MTRYLRLFSLLILFVTISSTYASDSLSQSVYTVLQQMSPSERLLLDERLQTIGSIYETKKQSVQPVIYHAVLAQSYATIVDHKNPISETLFAEAIAEAKKINDIGLLIWTNTQYGSYYYTYSDYINALPYFLESSRQIESTPMDNLPEANQVLIKNAYFFGTIDDNDKSLELLQAALKLTATSAPEYGQILYAIGLLYNKTQQWQEAESYFIRTLASSQANRDQLRYAKTLGELGILYNRHGQTEKAISALLKNIDLSKKNHDPRNIMYAQIQLARVYLQHRYTDSAQHHLNEALRYAATKDYLKGYEKDIIELQLEIILSTGDNKQELILRRRLEQINRHLSITDGQSIVDKVNWETQKERIRWQLEAEQADSKRATLLKWTWGIVSVLLLLVIVFVLITYKRRLNYQQLQFDKKILSFQIEKIESETMLSTTHNTLDSYKVYLTEKNEQIVRLESEISKLTDNGSIYRQKQRFSLENLLKSHLLTDENWFEFKKAFITENAEVYHTIIASLPDITESGLRIILLQKMGLDNHHISHLLGVTTDAVRKSKQRLRKKYGEQFDQISNLKIIEDFTYTPTSEQYKTVS